MMLKKMSPIENKGECTIVVWRKLTPLHCTPKELQLHRGFRPWRHYIAKVSTFCSTPIIRLYCIVPCAKVCEFYTLNTWLQASKGSLGCATLCWNVKVLSSEINENSHEMFQEFTWVVNTPRGASPWVPPLKASVLMPTTVATSYAKQWGEFKLAFMGSKVYS